jgi:hypothetical protein
MSEDEVRYLNYWWNHKSVINPKEVNHQYYGVLYDHKGRRVKIITYNSDGEILYYHRLQWKGSWLVQVEEYSPDGVLQHKSTYQYNKLGFLVEERIFSRDGTFLGSGLSHERDAIDALNQWLSDLIAFPMVETRGLINHVKKLFVNQKFLRR